MMMMMMMMMKVKGPTEVNFKLDGGKNIPRSPTCKTTAPPLNVVQWYFFRSS